MGANLMGELVANNGTYFLSGGGYGGNIDQIIVTSTSETYGSAKTVPMNENHPLKAQSPYAASKISADQIALSYFNSFIYLL